MGVLLSQAAKRCLWRSCRWRCWARRARCSASWTAWPTAPTQTRRRACILCCRVRAVILCTLHAVIQIQTRICAHAFCQSDGWHVVDVE